MKSELEKQTKPTAQVGDLGTFGAQDLTGEIPQVDDLLSEIDALLKGTETKTNGVCRC